MTDRAKDARRTYAELAEYAALRTRELSAMLQPYIDVTDRYGEIICRITLVLGQKPPESKRDAALRAYDKALLALHQGARICDEVREALKEERLRN